MYSEIRSCFFVLFQRIQITFECLQGTWWNTRVNIWRSFELSFLFYKKDSWFPSSLKRRREIRSFFSFFYSFQTLQLKFPITYLISLLYLLLKWNLKLCMDHQEKLVMHTKKKVQIRLVSLNSDLECLWNISELVLKMFRLS
jgi:hypothetical protein